MKKTIVLPAQRRKFLKQTMTLVLSATAIPALGGDIKQAKKGLSGLTDKKPALPADLVFEFVRVAHLDLNRVKELLDKEPMLINATWDWGGGDFETALGGASHIGNHDIAAYLLQHGARKDIFCAAMSGERDIVSSFIKVDAGIVNVQGPHQIPLLSHVVISGDIKMAELLKPHISNITRDCNRSLHPSVKAGHLSMVEWLFKNGANNPNIQDFKGDTPLQVAVKKENKEMEKLLKKYGAK